MSEITEIRYSVVRYVPDPIRQEVFNVGVVVAEGQSISAKVVPATQAKRLKALGYDRNLGFLKDLESELNRGLHQEQVALPQGQAAWTVTDLENAAKEWGGTIQFSPLRPGRIASESDALEVMFARLVPTRVQTSRAPTRAAVKKRVRTSLIRLVRDRYQNQDPKTLVQSGQRIKGKLEEHVFDYGVVNSRPLHLVQTVSFDVDDRDALAMELDATKWAIADLHAARKTPLSVVASGSRQRDLREQTESVLSRLSTRMFTEDKFEDWISFVGDSLPATIGASASAQKRR
jgi:hypothetical protein